MSSTASGHGHDFVVTWSHAKESLSDRQAGGSIFYEQIPIHETMRRLTATLGGMNIPFAIAGAMAANAHGLSRTTSDVNVLMRRDDLVRFKEKWLGRGWIEKFEGSKGFKDAQCNVNVDVLLTGDFPGDGLEKPVAFPSPEAVFEIGEEGIPFVSLSTLLELKPASGMTAVHRPRDLDDVIQLIRANDLAEDYCTELNPYVREMYVKLWHAAQVDEDY